MEGNCWLRALTWTSCHIAPYEPAGQRVAAFRRWMLAMWGISSLYDLYDPFYDAHDNHQVLMLGSHDWVGPPSPGKATQFLPGRKAGSSHGKPVAAPVPWSVEVSKPRACFDFGIELATPLIMVIRLFQCVVRQPYLLPHRSDQRGTPPKKKHR